VAAAFGVSVLGVLAIGAVLGALPEIRPTRREPALLLPGAGASAILAGSVTLGKLSVVFLKVGAVLFGSGYVLLAFLHADLVTRLHWLTDHQLLDAVAIGQVTPGPVFTTATFIGYVLAGTPGAVVATVAIFFPSFVYVALSSALLPRIRRSRWAGAALDGVTVASLALMAVVCVQLARAAFVDLVAVGLFVASAVALLRFRINSAWLVLAGAAAGLLRVALGHGIATG
jgi:chromate transporter